MTFSRIFVQGRKFAYVWGGTSPEIHSSGTRPVTFGGAQSSPGGAQFSLGGTQAVIWWGRARPTLYTSFQTP